MNELELNEKEKIMEHIIMELEILGNTEDLNINDSKTKEYRDNLLAMKKVLLTSKDLHGALEELKKKQDIELSKANKPLIYSRTRKNSDKLSVEELSTKKNLSKLIDLTTELIIKTNQ